MKRLLPLFALSVFSVVSSETELDTLPINHIQVIGSHNSYKQAIDPVLFATFRQKDSVAASKLEYSHIGLAQQLDMGLRNLEIDVYSDSLGGKFAHPKGLDWAAGQEPYDAGRQMNDPGFKMLHVPDLDFRSSALTLKEGLTQLKQWSETHPAHTIVFVTLEAKDEALPRKEFTTPEKFTARTYDELDKTLLQYLGREHILTPDQVRGNHKTLEEAVLKGKWPTVKATKGKFVFVLDAKGEKRTTYLQGHPSLKGRVLFANADPGTPEAAILFRNNAKDAEIPTLVKQGYIVRTRADADTEQARKNDYSFFEAASGSGAQIITTDYYKPSSYFKSSYKVSFDKGAYVRANPLFGK